MQELLAALHDPSFKLDNLAKTVFTLKQVDNWACFRIPLEKTTLSSVCKK